MEIGMARGGEAGLNAVRAPATRRERWAWYLYDFGNSAYAAVVLLAVYSAYFKQQVVGGAEGSRYWGLSVGIAMLVVALISPVLGAMADFSATKKRFLAVFTTMACVFTAMLFFVQKGDVFLGMLLFILAEIGYRGGQVFYNALLTDIAEPEEMGRVSGNGWAIGSLGGIVCLGIVLALITSIPGTLTVRTAFIITAIFYGLSTLPVFLFVRERSLPQHMPAGETLFTQSLRKLWRTFLDARHHREFYKFLMAFIVYNNGIMMVLDFAAIIGAVMFGMAQQQLIVFMMIVQVTSVIGAYAFGQFAQRAGGKPALVISLALMVLTVSLLFVVDSLAMFNVIGALAGFALTGVQSVSRTVVGQVSPDGRAAEYYGLFSVAGQLSNFTGPTLYGLLATALALRLYEPRGLDPLHAEALGLRGALIATLAFLALGTLLVFTVRRWQRAEH